MFITNAKIDQDARIYKALHQKVHLIRQKYIIHK